MYHARCLDLALSVECFWNYVQSEDEQCGSSVKCQRERLAHPRHPGASETRVLSQPPCLSTHRFSGHGLIRSLEGSLVIQAVWLMSSSLSPSQATYQQQYSHGITPGISYLSMLPVIDAYSVFERGGLRCFSVTLTVHWLVVQCCVMVRVTGRASGWKVGMKSSVSHYCSRTDEALADVE